MQTIEKNVASQQTKLLQFLTLIDLIESQPVLVDGNPALQNLVSGAVTQQNWELANKVASLIVLAKTAQEKTN